MAYDLPNGVTQGMIDRELEDNPMNMNLSHCFSCPRDAKSDDLFLCTETRLCAEHLGPMCRECLDAHTMTHHPKKAVAAA